MKAEKRKNEKTENKAQALSACDFSAFPFFRFSAFPDEGGAS